MLTCIPAHVVHVIPIKENVKRICYTQNIPALEIIHLKVSVVFGRESQQRKKQRRSTVTFLLNGHL